MSDAPLHVTVEDGLALVTVVGSGTGNALGGSFWEELRALMEGARRRDDIRAIALTGAGGTFSVGMDLRWYVVRLRRAQRSGDPSFMDEDVRLLQRAVSAVADCPKPVVALIEGECTGAALELAGACDIRYATRTARFALPEAELGVVADLGGLQRLPLLINQGHLRELAFTGRTIDAARAMRIGLVNDLYPDAAALSRAARELTDDLRRHPAHVMEGIKRTLDLVHQDGTRRGLDHCARWNTVHTGPDGLGQAMTARLRRPTATDDGTHARSMAGSGEETHLRSMTGSGEETHLRSMTATDDQTDPRSTAAPDDQTHPRSTAAPDAQAHPRSTAATDDGTRLQSTAAP
ncbi:enoyl-CoA hydratase-related protein [Streptomyces sp. NPDC052727]|uniref:enoyl-CoA hydratase-related protein n=1 Tax=Streptomyces sp. NPDC052727 TaxID=3154854 RepID=UPI003423E056